MVSLLSALLLTGVFVVLIHVVWLSALSVSCCIAVSVNLNKMQTNVASLLSGFLSVTGVKLPA